MLTPTTFDNPPTILPDMTLQPFFYPPLYHFHFTPYHFCFTPYHFPQNFDRPYHFKKITPIMFLNVIALKLYEDRFIYVSVITKCDFQFNLFNSILIFIISLYNIFMFMSQIFIFNYLSPQMS